MKTELCFIPPGGGETDFSLISDLSAPPNVGDEIILSGQHGVSAFVATRRVWFFDQDEQAINKVTVEAEFAHCEMASADHTKSVERYENKTGVKAKRVIVGY